MRQVCRVLCVLADNGPAIAEDIQKELQDLTEHQIMATLVQLCKKQKIQRTGEKKNNQTIYEYNENFDPGTRPKRVKTRSKSAALMNRKGKTRLSDYDALSGLFIDKKLDLLQRLIPKVSPQDKDMLLGIINDYKRLRRQSGVCGYKKAGAHLHEPRLIC